MKNSHSKIDKTKILMTNGSLMKFESIAECSPWSILQYFWPALSDNWSWKSILVFLRVAVLHRFYCISSSKHSWSIVLNTSSVFHYPITNIKSTFFFFLKFSLALLHFFQDFIQISQAPSILNLFMLSSHEYEIHNLHKYQNTNIYKQIVVIFLLRSLYRQCRSFRSYS